ncbi:MAG: cache domain-containing protein [Spirochaetota bacterium]
MKPFTQNSLSKTLFINSIIGPLLLFITLAGSFLWLERVDYRRTTKELESDFLQKNKEMVRGEVNDVFEYVRFRDNGLMERIKTDVKSRVSNACTVVEQIYSEMSPYAGRDEILEEIVETIRLLSLGHSSDYIFINSLEGESLLNPFTPSLEGSNLLESSNPQEKRVMRSLVRTAREKGAGFTTYKWPMPDDPGILHDKVAYIEVFEPLQIFIGSGEYLTHIEAEIQQETLEWISHLRFGNEGYIFVVESTGLMLSHIDEEYDRRNLRNYRDPEGFPVVQAIIDTAISDEEGGYVEYLWEKPSTGRQAPKLSFVKYYENWNWVFGAGVYLDALQAQLDRRLTEYRRRSWTRIGIALGLFAFVAVLSLVLVLFMARKVERSLQLFADFFQNSVRTYTHIDPDSLRYREFKQIAEYANRMVTEYNNSRRRIETSLLEKETLLKEVHHRVKNNLQLISSILNLQSTYLEDDSLLQYFKESQSRIFTMASVHEELYESENFQKIDLGRFLNRIVPDLVLLYSQSTMITYEVEAEEILVELNLAIPVGLIANEIVTNSIQHAFPNYQSGHIYISCRKENHTIELNISDNGIGIPATYNSDEPHSLGIQLIDTLVKQIHASYEIQNENGCSFHLLIPLQNESV